MSYYISKPFDKFLHYLCFYNLFYHWGNVPSFKKTLTLPLCIILFCVLLVITCSASTLSPITNPIQWLASAQQAALNHIKMIQQIDDTTTWTPNTQVTQTISMYDINGQINGYIFNLSTDGNKTGYIIVDKRSGTPSVSAFGYDEAFFTANGIPDMQASRTKILCFDTFNMAYKNGIHRQLFIQYVCICIIMIILALI